MQNLWSHFSSPRHLVYFEAAARTESFTNAAQELNVQQPAVSMTIKQLEVSLGVVLFERSHRKITLTNAGSRLFSDVTRAFTQLEQSAASIRQFASSDHVTLSASSAFNNYWLLPRLGSFQQNHPEIDLRLQSSDRESDLSVETISLAIRRGNGSWPECECALIAEEVIYPVAAPRVMAAAVNLKNVPGLLSQRLIHLEEPIRERPSWQQWFHEFGVKDMPPSGGLRLNDYALVLQAAIAGEGFAFGRHHLVDPFVRKGLLAGRPEWAWKTGNGFYLVWSKIGSLTPKAETVRDWVLKNRQPI
ncbi:MULTISPECIES: LysR substrate-binding domain-containing protein [unclassified Ruegeria]|uniref:LysR substrate-binding domain-containing protein n=1 Tax=unclassified Ruegeria TaxID=2625375 RepID=UPI001487D732|nr:MULTISPECIES: LysR substrate-binding domain-containing protein [unclassified Ruegeria]NOD35825.1 LysR family transcriptional regulator [Ruegeria sp. HKCCD7296]NOD47764.1 LysR family transcriptional regulator [Ruegeria sp. HKCCD5849]NOD52573.1 LysR family transcriptional regulator [Ruegeria sp. HKCCD5851]NOD65992.1 LysR family transcriptional regulator [Ruegeria sp. HKCCD7303]NOE34390.1 LysR family transcriptional regulator [Ruegeria sp. HKCCD7318]